MNTNRSLRQLKPHLFIKLFLLLGIVFLTTLLLVRCNYDRANFLYVDIPPTSPKNIQINNVTSSSANVLWSIPDDQSYPTPTFAVYTILNNTTNLAASTSNSTNQASITSLSAARSYQVFVRATNRAGHADSTNASFTTP